MKACDGTGILSDIRPKLMAVTEKERGMNCRYSDEQVKKIKNESEG